MLKTSHPLGTTLWHVVTPARAVSSFDGELYIYISSVRGSCKSCTNRTGGAVVALVCVLVYILGGLDWVDPNDHADTLLAAQIRFI